MAVKTLTTVTIDETGGLSFNFPEGNRAFESRAVCVSTLDEVITGTLLENLIIKRWMALNPAMDDPGVINGTTLEVNLASALNPVAFGQV